MGEIEKLEFEWGKRRGIGGKKKDVQFYESFTYDSVEYTLFDNVYLYKDGEPEPYIGKLIKIWENADKSKKVKVLWFFRPCEILNFLGTEKPLENELFLASGEGIGLANVNPLEAIAGKCNVFCISKDDRNPQPSHEELQLADFIFYRSFDVGNQAILEKIDEKVSGVEVKFIFNRGNNQKSSGTLKLDSEKKEANGETLVSSGQNKFEESQTTKAEGNIVCTLSEGSADPKASLAIQKLSLGRKPDFGIGVESVEKAKNSDNTVDTLLKEKANPTASLTEQKSSLGRQTAAGAVVKSVEKAKPTDRQEKFSGDGTAFSSKIDDKSDLKDIHRGKTDVVKRDDKQEAIPGDRTNPKSNALLVKQKSSLGEKCGSSAGVQFDEIAKTHETAEDVSGCETQTNSKVDSDTNENAVVEHVVSQAEVQGKSAKDFDQPGGRPSKKAKLDGLITGPDNQNKNSVLKLNRDADGNKAIDPGSTAIASEDKSGLKRAKDSLEPDNGSTKKPKPDDKLTQIPDGKLPKASSRQPVKEDGKTGSQVVEVTRKPDAERSKWFKGLPWEERVKNAHEHGTLVLLQNLDSFCTSAEVEGLVWDAFKENCSAKMIPQTAFSSHHFGRAFIIVKSKEVAEKIVAKLNDGCLMLSNGRPLVGSIETPCFTGKKSTFFGHLVIDKLKYQMQREMKEAVSTSHCCQPNTLEYDLALEWCLLQERSDRTLKKLYERQGQELRKLKAKLKSK